jgi:predicted SAM-dependent methyltransferase
MKYHLGCGHRDFGRYWIHVDGEKYPHVDEDDVWLWNAQTESADLIYSSHLLEYMDATDAKIILHQWFRVLKPGGTLRIAVPDFEGLFEARLKGFGLDSFLGPLYGKMPMNDKFIYHKTVYDFNSLKNQLELAGFKDVRRYDWRKTEHAHIDDHSQAYLPHMDKENGILISLNVEATK